MERCFPIQFVGEKNLRAVCDVAQALLLMFAGLPDVTDIGSLLSAVDGILHRRPRECPSDLLRC